MRRLLPRIMDACRARWLEGRWRNAGGDRSCSGGVPARDQNVGHAVEVMVSLCISPH